MESSKHYAVFYSKDGTIHLWPGESKEDCERKLYDMLKDKRVHDRCRRTTIIKRDAKTVGEEEFVFGSPASLNVLEKFDKDLSRGKVEFEKGGNEE